MKTQNMTLKSVDQIIAEHVEPAIRPLKKKVRELLAIEAACNAECVAVNVPAAEKEADEVWNAAAAGENQDGEGAGREDTAGGAAGAR